MNQAGIMEAGLRHSSHFLEVKISPVGHPTGPQQVMTFPFEPSTPNRSYTSVKFTTSTISESMPKVGLPEPPPPTIPRLIPGGTIQNTHHVDRMGVSVREVRQAC